MTTLSPTNQFALDDYCRALAQYAKRAAAQAAHERKRGDEVCAELIERDVAATADTIINICTEARRANLVDPNYWVQRLATDAQRSNFYRHVNVWCCSPFEAYCRVMIKDVL